MEEAEVLVAKRERGGEVNFESSAFRACCKISFGEPDCDDGDEGPAQLGVSISACGGYPCACAMRASRFGYRGGILVISPSSVFLFPGSASKRWRAEPESFVV